MHTSEKPWPATTKIPGMKILGNLIWFDTRKDYFESRGMLHQWYMRLLSPTESVLWIVSNREAVKTFGGGDLYLGKENGTESAAGLEIERHGYSILGNNGKLERASRSEMERYIEEQTLPERPIIYNYTGPNPKVLSIYRTRTDGRDLVIDGSHNPSKKVSIVVGVWDTERMEREGVIKECARS